ncbi:hypothetical protein MKW98_004950 [Papaver atlanticum]|uniref:Uncharacterized protein n=1 Tax=Papaver atlanticum TaxID=357466 RepID=A0AAD4SGI5_9MAGN|nr:hypothetical protein MKW98_004950 [Papaver atlanticum]
MNTKVHEVSDQEILEEAQCQGLAGESLIGVANAVMNMEFGTSLCGTTSQCSIRPSFHLHQFNPYATTPYNSRENHENGTLLMIAKIEMKEKMERWRDEEQERKDQSK